MQKLPFRPLRLIQFDHAQLQSEQNNKKVVGQSSIPVEQDASATPEKQAHSGGANKYQTNQLEVGLLSVEISNTMLEKTSSHNQPIIQTETTTGHLLKRTPNNYVLNQIYGLWFYISSFLFTILLTHTVSNSQYGVYAVIQTNFNTILYIVAFGLEDALTTFVPRIISEREEIVAAQITRYLLTIRVVVLLLSIGVLLFGLPLLATLATLLPLANAQQISQGIQNQMLISYSQPLALYILGSGIINLLSALCAAQMRIKIVFVISGTIQAAQLIFSFILLHLGWGITGVIWLQAIISLLGAAAFLGWQAPFLFQQARQHKKMSASVSHKELWQLGISAWLTNLASGALLKQISISMLGIFAVSIINIGYFNLSFQLADAANTLLVAGFAGVGGSALAAAFAGKNATRLAQTWDALIKVETLLAAPGLVFCLFNASNIAHALYGSRFDAVGPLLAIFIFFNLLVRILGTTMHQASMYVVGEPKRVVLSQWVAIIVLILSGIVLIPRYGPAGALIADGIARTVTGLMLLFFLVRHFPKQYPRDLFIFTLRFLLALIIAALPGILWHPGSRIMLVLSGVLFLCLCLGLLLWLKPLSATDFAMIEGMNPKIARFIRYFARR
ncbi:MAG TPA: polysaccharide biosynthesis C-terminal domain-containing protein [Dictyobacter sp.]|jgi:O-antigen/teichoic acid export membrane protein|nr:polysaccharide biosynthesis C-terminal domain-containing protein [Dictyobacter sp.]